MMQHKPLSGSHERRFRSGLILLIILSLSLLAVIGYIFVTKTTQQESRSAEYEKAALVVVGQKGAAVTTVERAYAAYAKDSGALSSSDVSERQVAVEAFTQYVTPAVAASLLSGDKRFDPILCSQSMSGALTYGDARLIGAAGTTVVIPVTIGGDIVGSRPIQVSVDTATNKISAIECPVQ